MSGFPSISKVQICGISKHDCGYCKDKTTGKRATNTSISYGFVSSNMSVEDYQSLMLKGWRRSGTYFYKPVMHKTCCPQYTIRLRANEHNLSKSQKKVLKGVQKFLSEVPDDISYSTEENLKISSMFTFSTAHKLPSDAISTTTTPSTRSAMKLTIDLEAPSVTSEKYELYRKYQIDVHHDKPEDISEQGFKRFLVDSPLKPTVTNPTHGTFHQLYRLNGVLIAVGVVDILPLGLSSVYLFYDNAHKQLSLGKYTALREIEYCKNHQFEYYFMGFYIHSCEKMRYKGEYKPSELLCPTTFTWHPLSYCSDVLDKFNFSPLEPTLAAARAVLDVDVGVSRNSAAEATEQANTLAVDAAMSEEDVKKESKEVQDEVETEEGNAEESESEGESEDEGEGEDVSLEPSALDQFAPMYYHTNTTVHTTRNTNTTSTTATTPTTTPTTINSTSNTTDTNNPTTESQRLLLQATNSIPLDIGAGRCIRLTDLRPESVAHVAPFLTEWAAQVGPECAARITVSLA